MDGLPHALAQTLDVCAEGPRLLHLCFVMQPRYHARPCGHFERAAYGRGAAGHDRRTWRVAVSRPFPVPRRAQRQWLEGGRCSPARGTACRYGRSKTLIQGRDMDAAGLIVAWASLATLRSSPCLEAATLAAFSITALTGPLTRPDPSGGNILGIATFAARADLIHKAASPSLIFEVLSLSRETALSDPSSMWRCSRRICWDTRAQWPEICARGPIGSRLRRSARSRMHCWKGLATRPTRVWRRIRSTPSTPLGLRWSPHGCHAARNRHCPQHAFELLTPLARLRLRTWVRRELRHRPASKG